MQYNPPLYRSIVSQNSCFVNGKRSKIKGLLAETRNLEDYLFYRLSQFSAWYHSKRPHAREQTKGDGHNRPLVAVRLPASYVVRLT
jgi:hypothetical protein